MLITAALKTCRCFCIIKLLGGAEMSDQKIKQVVEAFAEESKNLYGSKLNTIILYGSCARGDYTDDSDIDILLLLNVPVEELGKERRRIFDVAGKLDLEYDVVLAPVLQSEEIYTKYMPVSAFYQTVQREGVRIA